MPELISGLPRRRPVQHEAIMQRAVASYLRQLSAFTRAFTFSHPPNEGRRSKRSGAALKAAGMMKGEPDIVIYIMGGRTFFIELKAAHGTLSPEQKARHEELRRLGFVVHVVKASGPHEAVGMIERIMAEAGIVFGRART